MTNRVKCLSCPAMILESTARAFDGRCGTCDRKSRQRKHNSWTSGVCSTFMKALGGLLGLLSLPILLAFNAVRHQLRKMRFPFQVGDMYAAILSVHKSPLVARTYLRGVIKGYWDSTPEMLGWSQNEL